MNAALITGITGQDGSYLAELLLAKQYQVFGIARSINPMGSLKAIDGHSGLSTFACDIRDEEALRTFIRDVKPNEIYHLAAQSDVGRSFKSPESTMDVTGHATLGLLRIAKEEVPGARFFNASSAQIFGNAPETPQTETTPVAPVTPYGEAKALATAEGRRYRDELGFFVCNGILYNHESSRRGENFVTQKIARAAARIAHGKEIELRLGSLESKRDWGRAQDYVVAMWMMLQHDLPDDYIVATGATHSVREFVEAAFKVVDLDWEKFVRHDPAFNRPLEPTQLVGDASKIRKTLGWSPTGSFEQLVREMVGAELDKLKG